MSDTTQFTNDMKMYDENEAVAYMRKAIENSGSTGIYDDDELLNLVDIIWDFYEQNGLLDIDADDDADDDNDSLLPDLLDYANRMIKKDKSAKLDPADIEPLVKAEIEYEDSLLADD